MNHRMRQRRGFFIPSVHVLALACGVLSAPVGWANGGGDPSGDNTVTAVRIEGAQRIDPETVRSYLPIEVGTVFDAEVARTAIRTLHGTGFFRDVAVERDGGQIIVRVTENPMVSEVTFEGHDAFGTEELEKIVQVKARSLYSRTRVERDLVALRQAYRVKGLFLAEIEVMTKQLDQNQLALVYRISEGEKSRVREVRVLGNERISTSDLLKKLMIQPTDWLSWLTETDAYDREKLLFDQTQIRNMYLDRGYVRASVDSSIAELTPDRRAFVVTHALREGERYHFGRIQVTGDFDELPEEKVREKLEIREGDWYSRENLRQTVENLTDLVGDFGYAMLDVQPETRIDDKARTVDIDIQIRKGRRVYINRIEISGNTRTLDSVIRREMRLVEGDRFSATNLRRSRERLQSLGFFEKIDIVTPPTSSPDRVDLKVDVAEKSTGAFTVGAGFSSVDSLVGMATISQNNFMGRGQRMLFSFTLSARVSEFDVSFTEPYFMDRNVSAGIDLFNRKADRLNTLSFNQKNTGGALRFGIPISDHLSDRVSYYLSHVTITDVPNTASISLRDQADRSPYLQSMISNTLTWSNLDNHMMPTSGRVHRLTTDFAGLGGDVRFARVLTVHDLYSSLIGKGDLVGHVSGKVGGIQGLGEDVPLFERFYLGGPRSIRGFKQGGIGPRSIQDDPLGGTLFAEAHTELLFPFPMLGEKGVRGELFLDAGMIQDQDNLAGSLDGSSAPRVSAGVGALWNSPFGPLRFEFGFPIRKEDYDKTRLFDFSVGTAL